MKKVVHLIEQETSKRVSTKTIKRLLKNTALFGNASNVHQRSPRTPRSISGVQLGFSTSIHVKGTESVLDGILMAQDLASHRLFLMPGSLGAL
jgi:hypothetical protein